MTQPTPSVAFSDRGIEFGPYRLFPQLRLLLCDAEQVKLTARAFDILWTLVAANGVCVTKDSLLTRVWGDEAVEENNLQAHISAIRRALGVNRDMIVTEFGRGYRAIRPVTPATAVPFSAARTTVPSQLPLALTPMIGRDGDLESLVNLLDTQRLVTIVGPGGVGKTRLALEAARAKHDEFNGHVHFIEMAAVTAQAVWPALAEPLGVEPTYAEQNFDALIELNGQPVLVLLDNCEHVVEQVSRTIERLMHIVPDLHVLITSQQVLNADGECIFRLAPLAIPPTHAATKAAILGYPAAQLFIDRVVAHAHAFECADASAAAIVSICRQLDGIPLAIELAAARVPTLGVDGVLTGLANRFRLLTGGRRNAPHRHQTLRATVAWSNSLLTEDERRLFYGLSSFASAFELDTAHVVAGFGNDRWQVADFLASLVQKSLLQTDLSGNIVRYRLLETLREYAWEQLCSSEDIDKVLHCHTLHFLARSQQALADWKRIPTREWRNRYRYDSRDIRCALSRTLAAPATLDIGIRLLTSSIPFWVEYSMLDDCRHWVSLALDVSVDLAKDREMALQAALGTSLTWARGPIEETRIAWTRALTLAQVSNDIEIELQARYGLWLYELRTGNHDEAMSQANAMLGTASAAGDTEAINVARRIIGVCVHLNGDQAAAREQIDASLRENERHSSFAAFRFGLGQHAAGLAFLARALWLQGYTGQAVSTAELAVEHANELDHACTLCCALAEGLCTVSMLNRDVESVDTTARTLIETATRHGLQFWKAYGEIFQFWVIGRTDPTRLTIERTAALLATLQRTCFDFRYAPVLANLLDNTRLQTHTRSMLSATADTVGQMPRRHWAAPEFMRVAALTIGRHARTNVGNTERCLKDALEHAKVSGAPAWELRIAVDLARRLIARARPAQARGLLRSALANIPDGSASADWRDSHFLLSTL